MGPSEVLAELNRRGVEIAVDGDRLRYRPQDAVTPELRAALAEHKVALLTLLADDTDVAWRVEAMRRQIRPGPPLIIPFLVARRDFADAPGVCMSCGDPCGPGRRYRCGPCVRAAEIVVNEAWEGRRSPTPA
jgi:hypothetical protein